MWDPRIMSLARGDYDDARAQARNVWVNTFNQEAVSTAGMRVPADSQSTYQHNELVCLKPPLRGSSAAYTDNSTTFTILLPCCIEASYNQPIAAIWTS